MALALGARLGPYEVTAQIGAGGMGDVYRARDTRLDRDVAIKVLPESLAADPDRIARFQREAKTLAALNHPNIAQIHGLEENNGVKALVMELVEGPTLADRIAQGAIPVDEALPIAKQIAEALEAAHEQGIVHRDLKPANVKVRLDGAVKVLDFGLAKAMEPAAAMSPSVSQSPTITTPAMTQAGMILGTAAYMSPEQARGKPVDKRTDIWAFGCVLYQMLAGKRAFEAEDVSLTLAEVMKSEPDMGALTSDVPARVRQLIRVCLRKDPRQRIGDAQDIRLALEGAFETAPQIAGTSTVAEHGRSKRVALWSAAALVLGAAFGSSAFWLAIDPPSARVVRTEIMTGGPGALSVQGNDRDIAITPDGSRIVYRGTDQILVRALDQLEPMALTGLGTGPRNLFVSPDGQWVGFVVGDNRLSKATLEGGPPVMLATLDGVSRGGTWAEDGTIVFATDAPTGLQRVSANGGEVAVLTTPTRQSGDFDHLWPEFLPGETALLFTMTGGNAGPDAHRVAVLDLRTGLSEVMVEGGSHAQYVPSGHLVFARGNSLWAVAFDLDRLATVGNPVPVLEGVDTNPNGNVDAVVASNGTLVYLSGARARLGELTWVNRDGIAERVSTIPAGDYEGPRLSPDGRSVMLEAEGDLWVFDIASGRRTRLTRNGSRAEWAPTGSLVAFSSIRGGNNNVWVQAADGSGQARQVTKLEGAVDLDAWSPDGRVIAAHQHRPNELTRLLMVDVEASDGAPTPFVDGESGAENASFSPDGRYVAYSSTDSGQREIYIRPYGAPGGRTTVSVGGGREAVWARNGDLFYRSVARDRMMVVTVRTSPTLEIGTPREVFGSRTIFMSGISPRPYYDVTRDAQRFLMLREGDGSGEEIPAARFIVVQHWDQELRRLVPAD